MPSMRSVKVWFTCSVLKPVTAFVRMIGSAREKRCQLLHMDGVEAGLVYEGGGRRRDSAGLTRRFQLVADILGCSARTEVQVVAEPT